ncbi:uncharacterized protein [Montipora foliosa]|uniref:uncharacterized protein isoform X3 n=1 Tax=Montipora foliosa TaxID=591990 RepID=UPI0035F1EE15
MIRESGRVASTKQLHFANGFPPKGLVQAASPYRPLPYKTRQHLDEVSPRAGRARHLIPPLAKGRGQFCNIRERPQDERYRRRPDPFKLPKAAEKTGFSASQIKHAKARNIRVCRSTEPPSTATVVNLKNQARRAVYSTPPNRPLDSYLEDEVAPPSHCVGEMKANNIKIISDVEKESIQAELAGIEEVYQRVCQGKTESLYSLLYPCRRDTKQGPVHYINTSTPMQLRSPKINQHIMKPESKEKDTSIIGSSDTEKRKQEKNCPGQPVSTDGEFKQEDNSRPILIPLPYIRSQISLATTEKWQKPTYNVPYIYSNRTNRVTLQNSHAPKKTSPAVIMFNPMNLPELSRQGTPKGLDFGLKGSVMNKTNVQSISDGDPKISSSNSAPFISSPEPFQGVIAREETSNTLDVESIGSDTNFSAMKERNEGSFGRETDRERNSATIQGEQTLDLKAGKPRSDEHLSREIMAKEIQCNVITDSGLVKNVEIYDYDKRDVMSEQEAAKQIQELEELGEMKLQEVSDLLEEHQHILDEVKQLEKELHKTPS